MHVVIWSTLSTQLSRKVKLERKKRTETGGRSRGSAQAPRALGLAVIHTVHGQSTPYARTRALIGIGPAPRARVCPVSFCLAAVGVQLRGVDGGDASRDASRAERWRRAAPQPIGLLGLDWAEVPRAVDRLAQVRRAHGSQPRRLLVEVPARDHTGRGSGGGCPAEPICPCSSSSSSSSSSLTGPRRRAGRSEGRSEGRSAPVPQKRPPR